MRPRPGGRRFGDDYIYGLEHFERFPSQYKRIEHRFKMADRDWTEFCGYCHKSLMLVEMFRDKPGKGDDLDDKGVSVTRQLARGVGADAYVMAYLAERPKEVQAEIDRLNTRILDLTRRWPITRFRAQLLEPRRGPVVTYDYPDDWWELVALQHSAHHYECETARYKAARSGERLANPAWLARAKARHPGLWSPRQEMLWET